MANLGIHVSEKATAVSTPVVAEVGIPFVVGLAPVHAAGSPAKSNAPVLCTSWDEAVEKLGFSYDWKTYTLCEFMYSHFQLFGCQPVVFCNVLDTAAMKKAVDAQNYDVVEHQAFLPYSAIHDSIVVTLEAAGDSADDATEDQASEAGSEDGESSEAVIDPDAEQTESSDPAVGTALQEDVDYTVLYDSDADCCVIELLSSGSAYDAASLIVAYNEVKPDEVVSADIVMGLGQVDACMTAAGVIPDLICAPGFSHITPVAAIMATKAAGINGLFGAKALIDCDSGENGVRQYSDLVDYKSKSNFVDENQILCWPMVKLGDYQFHLSTQLAGLMAQVDAGNGGIPYESPSNKNLQIDGCCLEDGTEVNLTWEQVNLIAGSYGVVTALNFMGMGWTAKGNYTACYPSNTDVKDYFIPVSRMFDFVGNTLIRTFWSKLDKTTNRRLINTILDTCNIWLDGLVGSEYLLGARAEFLASENTETDLMAGIIHIHIYMTPASPAQEIDFTLEYDVSYVKLALAA